MSQTSYDIDQPEAFAGMKVDARFDVVESFLVEGSAGIEFGYGVVSGTDVDNQVRIPTLNKTTLSADADLIASNSTVVTLNGTALDAVVYATSHADTMAAIAAEIDTHPDVQSADYPGSGRDIEIIGLNGAEVSASAVTTGGASQAGWTQVQAVNGVFRGIAMHQHTEPSGVGTNDAKYNDQEAASIVRQGMVWVVVNEAVASDADAYLVVGGSDAGKFGVTSSGNIKSGKYRSPTAGAGIAKLEVILPAIP
jgi:hypothetical protein